LGVEAQFADFVMREQIPRIEFEQFLESSERFAITLYAEERSPQIVMRPNLPGTFSESPAKALHGGLIVSFFRGFQSLTKSI
jgi:hypothetical protein